MSDQPKKSNFFEKLATFIVDKRNLIFFLYAIAIIASLITQSWVKVCDDLTQYLPETTETRRGLTLMEDEMKTYGTARIIVSHVTYEIARDLADQIEDLNNIPSVDFWDADKSADDTTLPSAANKTYEDYMQGADALITVTFRGENDDQSAKDGLAAVKELLAPYDTYISTDVGYSKSETLNEEMGIILVVAALVIVLVLLLTSRSYAEVPVLLLTFVAAALLDYGAPIHPIYRKCAIGTRENAFAEDGFIRLGYITSRDIINKGTLVFIKLNYPREWQKLCEAWPEAKNYC